MDTNFGAALSALKEGKVVARKGWNAHHMLELRAADDEHNIAPYISMIIGPDATDMQGKIMPWVASQTDLMAEDWQVLSNA